MTCFLVDAMCGTLATHLRMCGYDTAYALERGAETDDAVLDWARAEERTVITRDTALAARAADAIVLGSRAIDDQLAEVAAAGVALELPREPTRCGRCNGRLRRLPADEPRPEDVPSPAERPVWRCPDCGQHFWRGSHWAAVERTLTSVRSSA